jgi:hypothetical protein
MRLGWVNGSCLATANKMLAPGLRVTVASLDDKASIVDGHVVGTAASGEMCPPLLEDRRAQNASQWSFYELKLSTPVDLGIGVTGDAKLVSGGIDITGDGTPEKFTQCSTSEGVSFRVWNGTPYEGMPIWSGDYYLGYDAEANCPS